MLLRAETDSTKPLVTTSEGVVGPTFAADTSAFAQDGSVQGYEGSQLITLLDPAGRQVFRRRLRKADFYNVLSRDVVMVSNPERPRFIGYHAPSQTLAFLLDVGIPYSDVWQECVIVLGLDGRVRRLAASYTSNYESPDCEPRLLPDGTVLTCQELLRLNERPVNLLKPKAQLLAAFPLSDTTLCTIYQYGEYHDRPGEALGTQMDATETAGFYAPEWVEDKARRNMPNAFISSLKGRVLKAFRYNGPEGTIGYDVPRHYIRQTHTYCLLDAERGVYLIDKHNPSSVTEVPFSQMKHFQGPQRPSEMRFQVEALMAKYVFYADTAQPTQMRYQRIARLE
ncbi:hypothetical protein GCM10011383_13300 [Hymenobacter cavernae]|uniref:Uncharacterized protein n=1 Tax=Hymenobacter cavernae TaxID=2044852 RepID=A0ABQ1TWW0_9BACT|nr:hypothetical protein GCM10011383_13300 [Hymenobacter cavernae]